MPDLSFDYSAHYRWQWFARERWQGGLPLRSCSLLANASRHR